LVPFGSRTNRRDRARKRQDRARKRKLIGVHCSDDMRAAVDQGAEQEMCSASAYARRAIRDRLIADGLLPRLDEPAA
jgi:hypothetical protein